MKHAIGAVAAVALGLSMAASAQAQTPQHQTNPSPNMTTPAAPMPQGQSMTQGSQPGSKQQARNGGATSHQERMKLAQRALQAEGFYKGKIDGKWGSKSRQALVQFEKHNNLPATGKLDDNTFAALTRATAPVGVGSSTPRQDGAGQMNMTPSQTTPTPGAGGNDAAGTTSRAGGAQH
jgi:hypothetical protein